MEQCTTSKLQRSFFLSISDFLFRKMIIMQIHYMAV